MNQHSLTWAIVIIVAILVLVPVVVDLIADYRRFTTDVPTPPETPRIPPQRDGEDRR